MNALEKHFLSCQCMLKISCHILKDMFSTSKCYFIKERKEKINFIEMSTAFSQMIAKFLFSEVSQCLITLHHFLFWGVGKSILYQYNR